ncbi:hypothetical protein GCK72_020920 [Caenorhabditis remanei]|uniref:Receptor L-domain domain-containing protein n=1 Tax=Caenorhabditis remanei TaxID=31234 RepID=A0A6A5GGS5_CAERE|nr:hypothetical protein GCK72_020920 [Caenorhabditis remanei]KAF1754360.1 hypothetical protein GCK72_020920 [Caenorhabditis remanei]
MWLWLFAPFLIRNVIAANFDPTEFFKTRCEPKCVFEASNLNSTNIDKFPKDCSTVCTDLAIDDKCDLTEEQLTATLQNMKHLVGSLIVISVKYTSVKFLAGLESVECGDLDFLIVLNNKMFEVGMTSLNTINCSSIAIDNNKEMTKLNVPNLKYMYPSEVNKTEIKVRIDGLSKKFCVTTEEMYNLMGVPNIDLDSLEGMHCEPATPLTNGKVCNSSYTLIYPTEILDGCTQYFGSLVINSENEKDVSKLKSVEAIFGPLFIEKTNLTSIDFLTNLKFISTLGYDTTAVQVINNPFLSNFSFPSLKNLMGRVVNRFK